MNTADLDRYEKKVRNLRATLAVVIAKLRLNQTPGSAEQKNFLTQDKLVRYIQSLVTQAMEGANNIEIPDFHYNREAFQEYDALKGALVHALTDLQHLGYETNLTLEHIYQTLWEKLNELAQSHRR